MIDRGSSWSNEVTVGTAPTLGRLSTNLGTGAGNGYEQQFRLGVVADHEGYRLLLLDFNAAYPIVDPEYAAHYMRGFQKSIEGLPHKFEISCRIADFSAHHESGTLKEMFEWIQEQGRGKWSFRMQSDYRSRAYNFEFYFEDEMTGVWGRMQFNDLGPAA